MRSTYDLVLEELEKHSGLSDYTGEAGVSGCSCGEPYDEYTEEGWRRHVAKAIADHVNNGS